MSGGRSGLFFMTEESSGLVTSSTLSGVGTGQKPPPVGTHVPPARDPFLDSSGVPSDSPLFISVHVRPLRASKVPVEQALPALPVCCDLSCPPIYGIPSAISGPHFNTSSPLKYIIPP